MPTQPIPPEALSAMERITGRAAHAHVKFLSSEFFEGREAGERGERFAAEYIAGWYHRLGLSPAGDEGSFFQTFRIRMTELGEGNVLEVTVQKGVSKSTRTFAIENDFLPFTFSPSADLTAPAVFAGYGITAPELGYDDYAKIDAKGKVVLVLRHEPQESNPSSVFKGLQNTRHAAFMTKARNAIAHGAAGMLLVTDPLHHKEPAQRRVSNRSLTSWASLAERSEFDRRGPSQPDEEIDGWSDGVELPSLHVNPDVADLLIGSGMGGIKTLEALQNEIDATLSPRSTDLAGLTVRIKTAVIESFKTARNVAARLEGSDPNLRSEHVIVGGHYDHVGWGHFGSLTSHWDKIHPGADDNASGTAGILSAAEAFTLLPEPPPRSILFLNFTAEEKGLLGSRWYTTHPTLPLDDAVAMFNLDMIGRNDASEVSIVGDRRSVELDAAVQQINQASIKMSINHDAGPGIERSDQYYFGRMGIPALAFFSGVHDDYHRPSDTADKVVPEKLEKVSRLVFLSAYSQAHNPVKRARSSRDPKQAAASPKESR